jgi:hypothetical protein
MKLDLIALTSPVDNAPITAQEYAEWCRQFGRKERVQ